MGKRAFVFGPAGYISVGCGQDLYHSCPEFRATFSEIGDLTGLDVARLCFQGPSERLKSFEGATFAQFALSIGCCRVLSGAGIEPDLVCALCEGTIMGWVVSGALGLEPAIEVCRRAIELIKAAPPGLMATIDGLDLRAVQALCRQAGRLGVIDVAIVQGPHSITVSGSPRAVREGLELARRAGAREARALPFEPRPVHSRLMEPAARRLLDSVGGLPFRDPGVPILSALEPEPLTRAQELLISFAAELAASLHWHNAVEWLAAHGYDLVLPGMAHGDLVRHAGPHVTVLPVCSLPSLRAVHHSRPRALAPAGAAVKRQTDEEDD